MEITQCTHVTPTEKKHLKAFLASGLTSAKVNTKTYDIMKGKPKGDLMEYVIRIATPYKNDFGERKTNYQTITLKA